MRIARFTLDQDPRYGVVEGEEGAEMIHVIGGDPLYTEISPTGQTHPLEDVRLLAPVIPRSKIIGVARNYRSAGAPGGPPVWFGKPNTTVIGPGDPIMLDARVTAPAFHEAELAIVIARLAKDVPAEAADKVILGYTVANDVGYRFGDAALPDAVDSANGGAAANPDPRGFFAKWRDTFTPLGPWIETDLEPERGLAVRSWLDGQARQDGSTKDLLVGARELVATASAVCTLLPGDVILTGTPGGAAPIEPGERVTCEVGGIGAITNPVVRR
ncbi:MAG: fumarylacetoacetate hydrolase family protein [Bifidobacteriaceae bacterium]|jgi:2-keto-4-pentenoate hydratase/2-oxohepta-3-ene-1,7-dioic acid hydratase in catechol pathway|nr:fumarylacetoacetate hydrolase family protein [Bifidobacteriaceae bacterium]